jgi:hypothetical protein
MNNENTQIHATLEQAEKLKKAGFDKKCSHYAVFVESTHCNFVEVYYRNILIGVEATDSKGFSFESDYFEGDLFLPTLGEIELHEGVFVCKVGRLGVWSFYDPDREADYEKYHYESELEARIEAWIYFNPKKEVQDE